MEETLGWWRWWSLGRSLKNERLQVCSNASLSLGEKLCVLQLAGWRTWAARVFGNPSNLWDFLCVHFSLGPNSEMRMFMLFY